MTLWSEDEHEINCREMPSLPNLKSFTLGNIYHKQASYAMRTVNYENITNLKLHSFDLLNLDSENLNIRNLSALILDDVYGQVAVALLKSNSSKITKLVIGFFDDVLDVDFSDIKFSKLKRLSIIQELTETDSFTLIKNASNTLEEIHLCSEVLYDKLPYVRKFKLPRLKKIHLEMNLNRVISSKLVRSLIYACNENNTIFLLNNEKMCRTVYKYLLDEFKYDAGMVERPQYLGFE